MNPKARNPVLVVDHTPGIPARYEVLLKNISFLLSWENQGKSYKCSSNEKNMFLNWSKADNCLFFEWEEKEERMVCWMHDIPGNSYAKFLVNPAIKHGINDVTVKCPALAFSSGFGDGSWAIVKNMLSTDSVEHDHLYVFTRTDSSFCIRNYEIDAVPNVDDHDSPLVLTEINPFCCFKLLDAQGIVNQVSETSENQVSDNQLFRTVFYSVPSHHPGSYTPHSLNLNNGIRYQILLKNDRNLSLVAEYDGFNISLDHLLSKEPASKIKHMIGSRSNKESVFVRNRFKFILRSMVLHLQDLFASKKCLDLESKIGIPMSNVLIRGTSVKFYGLKITDYTDKLARKNLLLLADLMMACFPQEFIPVEVRDALGTLCESEKKVPLDSLEELKGDCLWLRAEERRMLLISHHSEYMTNFDIKEENATCIEDEPDADGNNISLKDCPYIDTWQQLATDNEYLMQVTYMLEDAIAGSVGDATEGSVEGATESRVEDAFKGRTLKKLAMNNRSKSVNKRQKKRKGDPDKGKIQFESMRNYAMHLPEKAKKDGIRPFRSGLVDYILTGYYPKYLAFVHRKISSLLRQRKLKKVAERQ